MTKTFTPISLKSLSKPEPSDHDDLPDQHFYQQLIPKLDQLYRNPSEETIAKILKYAKDKKGQ